MITALLMAASIAGLPQPVRGDFDHDGKRDLAEIVPSGGAYQLIIRRGAKGHPLAIVESFNKSELTNIYLTTEPPGELETWCGKGGGSDDEPCPRKSVVLKGDTLAYGVEEASMSVVIWTGKRFEVVLMSD